MNEDEQVEPIVKTLVDLSFSCFLSFSLTVEESRFARLATNYASQQSSESQKADFCCPNFPAF